MCPANIDGKALVLQMRRDKVAENDGKIADKGYDSTLKEKKNYLFKIIGMQPEKVCCSPTAISRPYIL